MIARKLGLTLMILAVFTFANACGGESGESGAEQIRTRLNTWRYQFNARNADAVCDLFAPDLVDVFQGQPDRNFDQLCTFLRNSLNNPQLDFHYDLDIKDVFVSGGLGAVRLVWTLTVTHPDGSVADTSIEP